MKITKDNGVIVDGKTYYCVGSGNYSLVDQGEEIFGSLPFYTYDHHEQIIEEGMLGDLNHMQYYLTEDQVDEFNEYHHKKSDAVFSEYIGQPFDHSFVIFDEESDEQKIVMYEGLYKSFDDATKHAIEFSNQTGRGCDVIQILGHVIPSEPK